MKLKGKVAIITGGAAGIGFATSKIFLKEGAAVAIGDVSMDRIVQAESELKQFGNVRGFFVDIASCCNFFDPGCI